MRPRLSLSLVLAPAALILAACSPDPSQHAAKARAAFAAEDFAAARIEALAALDGDGRNADLLVLLVQSQLRLGDGDGAQAALARLVDAGRAGPDITRYKAEAALLRGQPRQALDWLGTDDSPSAWRVRAAAHYALHDYPAAMEAFHKGMAGKPDLLLARDYARILLEAQDYAGAGKALEVMQRLAPDALDTLLVAGELAQRQGRRDEAAAIYARAAERHPRRIEPLLAQAMLADMAGKVDAAAGFVDRAAAIAGGDSRVVEMKVQIAAEKGDWETVRNTLASSEGSLDPRSPNGLKYAEAQLALGHPEQARAIFAKALLLSPQNPYVRIMLAEAQLATGEAASALRTVMPLSDAALAGPRELDLAVRAATAAGDPAAGALKARLQSAAFQASQQAGAQGRAAMARQDWAGAIAALRQVTGFDGDAEVLKMLAFASSNAGQHDEAIAYADRALALAPRNPDMIHIAGLVRLNAGRSDDATMRLLKDASEADPANRLFRADLARGGALRSAPTGATGQP
ncbi:tetratricopeptide repeat protein [Novosphingobium sp. KCTC 2891]|uniref:tetratricopeptide repeat protein n=1 Tax=Novosphingobium sp. KCTC 2891 TaxID=2989730 RepID=UPI00222168E6|nr:tetratricopeptide repeat protein [Novosphingobium sp. KCTC 2891]MCW1381833.1 tetratricopeptide repeat protein [Novosphingobium sp. KCTC 2891]